jgi:hypothetical protein
LIPGGVNYRFAQTFELFWSLGYECRLLDGLSGLVTADDITRWADRACPTPLENHDFLFCVPSS